MSSPEVENFLVKQAFEFRHDPLGFVLFAFPGATPHPWQRDLLSDVGEKLQAGAMSAHQAIREAVSSGHSIGKSCLVSWVCLWAMTTKVDCRGVITANTANQLSSKTWAELAKWHNASRYAHWFELTATALIRKDPKHEKTWRLDAVPWSERNTEAFAGLHNKDKRILLIFDEASGIADRVWDVAEGALVDEDTEIIWLAFGNPTRPTGKFRECFGRMKHRWTTRTVDSRTVPGVNRELIDGWVSDYGENSDFVKVRVRGIFPSQASNQFIPEADVLTCRGYKSVGHERLPKLLACDVARFGDDQSVIGIKQGRKFEVLGKYRGLDTQQLAARVSEFDRERSPDFIIIDGVGVGAGVVDTLRMTAGSRVVEFNGGARAEDPAKYANARAETWGRARDALKAGMELPDDDELLTQLTAVEYGFTPKQQILLEKKESMKSRGLESPDVADCFTMTFAIQPSRTAPNESEWSKLNDTGNPYGW